MQEGTETRNVKARNASMAKKRRFLLLSGPGDATHTKRDSAVTRGSAGRTISCRCRRSMKNAAPSSQLMMGCVEPYTAVTTGDAALPAAVVSAYTELDSTFRVERRSNNTHHTPQCMHADGGWRSGSPSTRARGKMIDGDASHSVSVKTSAAVISIPRGMRIWTSRELVDVVWLLVKWPTFRSWTVSVASFLFIVRRDRNAPQPPPRRRTPPEAPPPAYPRG